MSTILHTSASDSDSISYRATIRSREVLAPESSAHELTLADITPSAAQRLLNSIHVARVHAQPENLEREVNSILGTLLH